MKNNMNDLDPKASAWPRRLTRYLIAALQLIIVVAAISTFLGRHLFIAELANSFRLQIAAIVSMTAIVSFYARLRIWATIQLIIGIAVFLPLAVSWLSVPRISPGPEKFTLISHNFLAGNPDKEPVVDLLSDQFPDVLIAVEYEDGWVEPMKQLGASYRYSVREPRWHGFGIAVFSKYPMQRTRIETVSDEDIPIVLTEITIGEQPIILAAAHFLAPIKPQSMRIRNAQFERATRLIQEYRRDNDKPVVFAGDFNSVPWSPFVRDMITATGLRDSRQGYFYQGSWPADNPLLRIPIDNVFVSERINVHERMLLNGSTSDHIPVFLELSIADTDQPASEP